MNHDRFNLSKNLELTFDDCFRSLPLMTDHLPMVVEYLETLHDVLFKALGDHRRVSAYRFDLRLPDTVDANAEEFGNAVVSRFIASLKAKIEHNREVLARAGDLVHDTRVRYFWVREIGDSGRVHYHFVVLLNGHAFYRLGKLLLDRPNMVNRIWEAWASALGSSVEATKSLVHIPENPSYVVVCNDQNSIANFFYRASYLCKARTKHYGNGHHGYGSSRH